MKSLSMLPRPINAVALHEELLTELGAEYIGLSTTADEIVLHFADNAASDAISLAQIIVKSHDALKLSATQQAEKERIEELARTKDQFPNALDASRYANENNLILEMAERLRRLELLIGEKHAR
jgi:FKBP-type peptidyl-prolyl cis-trans isomerase (trigger factor)